MAGELVCLVVTVPIWRSISAQQGMWPLPGLYLLEMVALSVLCAFAFYRGGPRSQFITWGALGVFLAFSILGAFSIGFFYLPVALIFGAAAIIADVKDKDRDVRRIGAHLAVCVIAGLAQAALMLAATRLV